MMFDCCALKLLNCELKLICCDRNMLELRSWAVTQVKQWTFLCVKKNLHGENIRMESDTITLSFFYFPTAKSESTPFEFKDSKIWQGKIYLNLLQAEDGELLVTSFSSLTFYRQKNLVWGETIVHSRSLDPGMCPVRFIVRHIIYLRLHNALPNTTLDTACNVAGSIFNLKTSNITTSLK